MKSMNTTDLLVKALGLTETLGDNFDPTKILWTAPSLTAILHKDLSPSDSPGNILNSATP